MNTNGPCLTPGAVRPGKTQTGQLRYSEDAKSLDTAGSSIILSRQQITKGLIGLCGCTG